MKTQIKEESYYNLCRFSDLSGLSFGYAGGAKRASQLIEDFRNFLTFDDCGNITGYSKGVNRAGLSAGVWEMVKND